MTDFHATGVDHLVVATPDMLSGVEWARRVLGVEASTGGRHPRWGTRNALVGLGPGCYLEILAPDESVPAIFGLDRAAGPTLAAWCLRTPRLEEARDDARRSGLDLGPILDGEREGLDGTVVRWRLTDPAAVTPGSPVPFLIGWAGPSHPSDELDHDCRLEELRLFGLDPGVHRAVFGLLGVRRGETAIVASPADRAGFTARIDTPAGVVELSSDPGEG